MEYAFCARSRRAVSFIAECPRDAPPISHWRLNPALTREDNLLTWDDDPRGSMRRLVAADVLSAINAQDSGAAHKRGLAGLLAEHVCATSS